MLIDLQLAQIMRNASQRRRVLFLPPLNDAMDAHDITTPLRMAAFLAQLAHESGELQFMEEIWGPTAAQKRYDPPSDLARKLGNTQPGDGRRFKGRGPIQITGRAIYRTFGDLMGLDLVDHPDQAATPDIAFAIAGLFWERKGLNELADAGNFTEITRRINGGQNGAADRERFYAVAQQVLGASAPVQRAGRARAGAGAKARAGAAAIYALVRGSELIVADAEAQAKKDAKATKPTKAKSKAPAEPSRVLKASPKTLDFRDLSQAPPTQHDIGQDGLRDAARDGSLHGGDNAESLGSAKMVPREVLSPIEPSFGTESVAPADEHMRGAEAEIQAFDLLGDEETAGPWTREPPEHIQIKGAGEPPNDGTPSPGMLAAEAMAPTFSDLHMAKEPEGGRWINAVLEDHDAGEPLIFQSNYVLAISIDLDESAGAGAVGAAQASNLTRDPNAEIKLTVTLNSSDFDISQPQRPLTISKGGLSIGKARFDIQPKIASGSARLTAIIHRENNFVQQLDITLEVGEKTPEGVTVTSVGRPVEVAQTLSRRDIGISIQPSPIGGYECMTWGANLSFAHLPISVGELAQGIDSVRRALLSVVMAQDANGLSPFLEGIVIKDPAVSARGLQVIARAGYLLFRSLFFHPDADAQCQSLGKYLIDEVIKADEGFTLQVLARDFPVPWSLLYLTDTWDENAVKWEGFLGAKLIVEQIPLCNDSNRRDTRIPGTPGGLAVSLNFNSDIDQQFSGGLVADQQAYWNAVTKTSPSISSVTRTSKVDLINSLKDGTLSDQIIYFYCHAESLGLGAGGGPGQSRLIMSGPEQVTLDDLNLDAPAQQKLRGAPLVFINACESGKLSPLFYNGFVPYFLSKGARGVIGTECKVPALFASEWAKRFFDEFLGGTPIGETVLKLRNEFFTHSRNPLGLLYGVHCNADTQIHPLP